LSDDNVPEKKEFIYEVKALIKQINSLAIRKFEVEDDILEAWAEMDYKDVSKCACKVDALVNGRMFKYMVVTKERSLSLEDHYYYKTDVAFKMVQGIEKRLKMNLDYLAYNAQVLNWICKACETMQTAHERQEMRKSMKLIPKDFYNKTQLVRIDIGSKITTRICCENVATLLDGRAVEDAAAKAIWLRYENEYIGLAPTLEANGGCRRNVILSLNIRTRQLE
jgi:hypothetical protein